MADRDALTWRVRRASRDDAAALSLIAGASFLDSFAGILDGADIVAHCAAKSSPAAFAEWSGDAGSVVTIAACASGGAPIGYSVLTTPDLPVETVPGDIELRRIYTLGRMYGTGVGPALMQTAIDDARGMARTRMLIGVYGGNARAHRFYERYGFAMIGTRQFQVGATVHDDRIYARNI